MGIPSYFSYIIKNYTNIIHKLNKCGTLDHLFMDCNSIVYDSYYELEEQYKKAPFDVSTIEQQIITKVIDKIENYIRFISPSKSVYIAFDGVAPFAKMDQQRIRRYKTSFTARLSNTVKIWNTSAITPGTKFMETMSTQIYSHFRAKTQKNLDIIISCSDEPGEGEHKLFKYIREHDCSNDYIAVYGLDSDLIMLSIFHKQFTKNIFIFREAPNFKNVLSRSFDKQEKLFMNIDELCNSLMKEMGGCENENENENCITDYIFMCFLLGNDFLPHFAALNIRTNGFQILLDTYLNVIGKYKDRNLVRSNVIQWKWVKEFLNEIGKHERQYILNEYAMRDKMDNRSWSANTPAEKEQVLANIPIIQRQYEKYICPQENGWETRYKRVLLVGGEERKYMEGLEWVLKYYTKGCEDERWRYRSDYAPLIKEIVKKMDERGELIKSKSKSYKGKTQLAYVLPYENLYLLGEDEKRIKEKYKDLYPLEYELKWAFCRYFWEAHPILPEIKEEVLDEMEKMFST